MHRPRALQGPRDVTRERRPPPLPPPPRMTTVSGVSDRAIVPGHTAPMEY